MSHSPAAIRQFLIEQPLRGQTVADFCEDHDLKVPTFYSWKKKYSETEAPVQEGFWEITPKREVDELEAKYNSLEHRFEQLLKLVHGVKNERFAPASAPEQMAL